MFKIKDGYKLELQTPENMKFFGSTKNRMTKQRKSEVLCTSTPNKSYGYLLNVELSNLVFLKTCNTEFDEIIITFTDQNDRPLEIEDKDNLTLLINEQGRNAIL